LESTVGHRDCFVIDAVASHASLIAHPLTAVTAHESVNLRKPIELVNEPANVGRLARSNPNSMAIRATFCLETMVAHSLQMK
jgi:hypothetical protein